MSILSKTTGLISKTNISKIKIVAISLMVGLLIATVTGVYIYTKSLENRNEQLRTHISLLTANNLILSSNNATLKNNLDIAVSANAKNNLTIESLLGERNDIKNAIIALAKIELANRKKLENLNATIDSSKGNADKDGPLAPILRDTIKQVQEMEWVK